MRFHASVSDNEASHEAIAAVIADARGTLKAIDVAFVFFTGHHRDEAANLAERLWLELDPQCIVGCSAEGVIGGTREIERAPGISLLVGELPGVHIHPFHIGSDDWRRLILDEPQELVERIGDGSEARAGLGLGGPLSPPPQPILAAPGGPFPPPPPPGRDGRRAPR